jgi:hypothetical protein
MTTRMFPPTSGNKIGRANGRVYSTAAATLDVPDFDALGLEANGWVNLGQVGATSARPAAVRGAHLSRYDSRSCNRSRRLDLAECGHRRCSVVEVTTH